MDIYIIGGGAAGMMAAIHASRNKKARVFILEKNDKLGKKLYITGKGRCNITNATSYENYFDNIISNPNFMRSALRSMSAQTLMAFLKERNLPIKVERGDRVFPKSNKSSDVIKALTDCLNENKVKVLFNKNVIDFEIKDNKITSIITEKERFTPQKVIIATGGKSYPATGSNGSMYKLIKKVGHSIVPLQRGLVPIISSYCYNIQNQRINLTNMPSLQGLSLKNISVKIIQRHNKKCLFTEFGELLFTHNGLSGPTILTLSSKINRHNLNDLLLIIDLKPALDFPTLDKRIIRDFQQHSNKLFKNSLHKLLPMKLIPFIINLSNIEESLCINNITREQRQNLCYLLKNLTFEISSLDSFENAIITAGGVNTKEINPKTLQSKLIENLYFAGEVIDIDALTGGFNLQIAFATGSVAGHNAGKN